MHEGSKNGANSAVAFNGLTNLANFAAGLDPTTTAGTLTVDGVAGTVTSLGPPQVWSDSTNGKLYFRYTWFLWLYPKTWGEESQ